MNPHILMAVLGHIPESHTLNSKPVSSGSHHHALAKARAKVDVLYEENKKLKRRIAELEAK